MVPPLSENVVLTTQGGIAGTGLDHLLGIEHDSTPQSGVAVFAC